MSLFVGNISRNLRPRDLEDEFAKFGRNRIDNKGSYAFCEFDDERDAEDAVDALHGKDFDGCKLTVEWGKRSSRYNPDKSRAGRVSDVRCYSCGEPGHFSRQCPRGRGGGGGYDRYGDRDRYGGDRYRDRRDRSRDRYRDRRSRSRSRSRSRDRRRRSYSDDDRDRRDDRKRDDSRDRKGRDDSRDRKDRDDSRDRRDRDDSRDRRDRDDSRDRRDRDDSRDRKDRDDSRDRKDRDDSRDRRDRDDSRDRDEKRDDDRKEEVAEESAAEPAPAVQEATKDAEPPLSPSKLKVTELKAELAKRGLDQKGLKGELCARLEEAIAN